MVRRPRHRETDLRREPRVARHGVFRLKYQLIRAGLLARRLDIDDYAFDQAANDRLPLCIRRGLRMPKRRDVRRESGDSRFIIRAQWRKALPAVAVVVFLDRALVLQGLFPLAFECRRHQPDSENEAAPSPL